MHGISVESPQALDACSRRNACVTLKLRSAGSASEVEFNAFQSHHRNCSAQFDAIPRESSWKRVVITMKVALEEQRLDNAVVYRAFCAAPPGLRLSWL